MSKVIHLSDSAHTQAKAYCREHALKMSDWVASLIHAAVDNEGIGAVEFTSEHLEDPGFRSTVPKKKVLEKVENAPQTADDGMPAYAAPPFWAQVRAEHPSHEGHEG